MTNILAIDTTLGSCSVALYSKGKEIISKQEIRARGHVERLIPMIDEVMLESTLELSELNFLATTIGPGTFAGVRVGLSAIKGMGLALDIPVIPVTGLEAIAWDYLFENKDHQGELAVAIDARRGEIYWQVFSIENGLIEIKTEASAKSYNQIADEIKNKECQIIGSGALLVKNASEDTPAHFHDDYQYPRAEVVAQIAFDKLACAICSDDLNPLYLRAPDAKLPTKSTIKFVDE